MAKADISPMSIIWIFYALEALFDTKVGENFRALLSRAQILLNLETEELGIFRKKLRALYDLRSALVHGGMDVIHPMHNESLDDSVDESIVTLMNVTDFGFQIVLASIQQVIKNGWREPNFTEVLADSPKIL
jgi:hypothetical protein